MEEAGLRKVLHEPFDNVLARVPEALKSEGFGVLTRIDIQGTLKEKLGVEFRRYQILGACNPPLAHQALGEDLEIGIMLPCNVVVYETDEGATVVSAVDPARSMASAGSDSPKLGALAAQVREKLVRALARLSAA